MVEPLRHRQTKEAATDMFGLPPPRHISTLPKPATLLSAPLSAFSKCGHEYTRGYAHVVCAMSRGATERDKKLFFRKNGNRKSENQKIAKTKNTTFPQILRLREKDRGSKDVASFSNPRCAVEEVRPNLLQKSRAAAEPWTFSATSPR
jgi:hypothetical protein